MIYRYEINTPEMNRIHPPASAKAESSSFEERLRGMTDITIKSLNF